MYKLIACDMDETLLNTKDRKVSAKNVETIQRARQKGVKFVPATGRGYRSIQGTLEELGLINLPNEYVISFNGGAIVENQNNRLLHFDGISFELAEEFFKRGLNYDVCIHVYTLDTVYVYNFTDNEKAYLNGRMEVEEFFDKNINFLKGQEIVKALYVNTNQDYLHKIEAELKDITADVDVSYSSNRYIEFNHKGVNKGQGLLNLAKRLGIKQEETIAIGDNFNDISMIEAAGLGVGVANCVEGIKPQCDYITSTTCDEDAVAEVIDKFILNADS